MHFSRLVFFLFASASHASCLLNAFYEAHTMNLFLIGSLASAIAMLAFVFVDYLPLDMYSQILRVFLIVLFTIIGRSSSEIHCFLTPSLQP